MNILNEQIEHIVVLMMENRSFDHMLGYLTEEEGRGDVHGLTGQEYNINPLTGQNVFVHPLGPGYASFNPDPSHSYAGIAQQLGANTNPAAMDGFIRDFSTVVQGSSVDPGIIMGYYNKTDLPVYDFFADQYCLCDAWYCSVPGETWPNRLFSLAGNSDNWVNNPSLQDWVSQPFNMPTIFNFLTQYSPATTWEYYSQSVAFLHVFEQHLLDFRHIQRIERFYTLAEEGSLPQLSWIDPRFTVEFTGSVVIDGNDDHPPADIANGQEMVGKVYNALVNSGKKNGKKCFERTLFIVVYDEHGGFYDHVPPPYSPPPFEDESGLFNRYGVRVPAFLISPWIQARSVSHTLFDHTSVLNSILRKFCADSSGNIPHMGDRDDKANNLSVAFDEVGTQSVRTDYQPAPPVTPAQRVRMLAPGEVAKQPSEFRRLMQGVKEYCLMRGVPLEHL
jgi:phospholipase C